MPLSERIALCFRTKAEGSLRFGMLIPGALKETEWSLSSGAIVGCRLWSASRSGSLFGLSEQLVSVVAFLSAACFPPADSRVMPSEVGVRVGVALTDEEGRERAEGGAVSLLGKDDWSLTNKGVPLDD